MSEPRCRVLLTLLPNIRHNCLRALGEHLSQCVKRLQGIPLPEVAARPPPKRGAAAARARAKLIGQRGANHAIDKAAKAENERKAREDEEARWQARVFDNGWKEGPFFKDLDGFAGILAGCPVSTFRRCFPALLGILGCPRTAQVYVPGRCLCVFWFSLFVSFVQRKA